MFGLSEKIAVTMFRQVLNDVNFAKLISDNATENWTIITLPDTHEINEGYPF